MKPEKKRKLTQKQINYCVRDATITYRTAKLLYDFYAEFNYKPKTTLPSTALHIWKDKFWKKDIYLPDEEIIEFARETFFGGRTEAFALGEYKDISVIDASSMYPWAMRLGPLPIPWETYTRVKKNEMVSANGIYRIKAKSEIKIPALPIRTDKGLIFPNGSFEGYFVGEEILYAQSIGISVNVISGYEFHNTCNPFDGYVETFFKKKQASRGSKRLMYKLMLNSLYGKFSQRGEHIVSMPLEEFRELKDTPEDFKIWNGLVLFEQIEDIPPWGNVVWSAIITARARIRLHKEMRKILDYGGRVLYCDTDSVIFTNSELKYPDKAEKPGDFEKRGRYKKLVIVGKKEYMLQDSDGKWTPYCKGVPSHQKIEYLKTGKATYVKPVKIRESTRTNQQANVWKPVSKTRRFNFDDREKLSDGSLLPVTMNIVSGKNSPKRRVEKNGNART